MRDRTIIVGCILLLATSVLIGFFQSPLAGPGSYWTQLVSKENLLYNIALLCFSIAAVVLARWVALKIRTRLSQSRKGD